MNLFRLSSRYLKRARKKIRNYTNYLLIRFFHNSGNTQLHLPALDTIQTLDFQTPNTTLFQIFGKSVDLKKIEWHKDYVSGFQFPEDFCFNIRIHDYINRGYDIKWPWELSRFYFAPILGRSKNSAEHGKNYHEFKAILISWINENPVCKGVNWFQTMEVAIRAVNIAFAANLFREYIEGDLAFRKELKKILVQHAKYMYTYPELYGGNYTTNHTTSNYAGLLFLAVVLKNHPDSDKWLQMAVDGLEKCIIYQTYDDGVNFEASVSYHRFVLEMFSLSALVATSNNISLSNAYFQELFRMFEYTASYIDQNGNAPQVGDNDSGRFLWFNDDEHNHAYLLEIGNRIFDYDFKKPNKTKVKSLVAIETVNISPRKASELTMFGNGGACILKNRYYSLFISCFPIGTNGNGGHNHMNDGSFTLSIAGIPIVVDPGTYSYTRDVAIRNKLRNYSAHNVILSDKFRDINLTRYKIWELKKPFESRVIVSNNHQVKIEIANSETNSLAMREFILDDEKLMIHDFHKGFFKTQMNLNHKLPVEHIYNQLMIDSRFKIESHSTIERCEGFYSDGYGQLVINKNVVQLSGRHEITTSFEILDT